MGQTEARQTDAGTAMFFSNESAILYSVSEIKTALHKSTETFSVPDASDEATVNHKSSVTKARLKIARLKVTGDLETVFEQIVQIAARVLDTKRVGIWFFNVDEDELRGVCLYDARRSPRFSQAQLKISDYPVYCRAVLTERFLATSHAGDDEQTFELKAYCRENQVSSLVDAAIYRNGEVVGMVCHEHVGPSREWLPEQRQFAATVADMVSNYMEVHERILAESIAHEFELALKDTQRLDAISRLAAGVAHDINNLLATVNNSLTRLSRPDCNRREVEGLIRESVHHVSNLTGQLLMLGRKQLSGPELHDATELMQHTKRLVDTQLGEQWKVIFDCSKDLTLWADVTQFSQVILNLVLNAAQSMPAGGTTAVRLRRSSAKDSIAIEVIDAGQGVAPENISKIFEPFFSTKSMGNGLGLAVVEQLVHLHGGTVRVSSRLGDGTTFHLLWPSEPR
jgi:two-component system, cell cycle sensor histidine kinase and response regulator CckA